MWALTTDPKNSLLIAGDTAGYMYVFDISSWCLNGNNVRVYCLSLCVCVSLCVTGSVTITTNECC